MTWTTPRTWVAGETVTAALMNTHVRDNLLEAWADWTSWSPTIYPQSGSYSDASATGAYKHLGHTVNYFLTYTITTVGSGSGVPRFDLPVAAHASGGSHLGNGRESAFNGNSLSVIAASTTAASVVYYDNANPMASIRNFDLAGTYRAAAAA